MIAIVLGLGVLILIEGPEIITQHVKNLKLVQKGTSIEVTWDEMECEGYVVMIRMEEERATYPKLETNSYTIENAALGKTYKVKVVAQYENGHQSRANTKKITPEKFEQEVTVDLVNTKGETETLPEVLEGFPKTEYAISASAENPVLYTSDDSSVAKVNDKGEIKFNSPGRTTIRAQAIESGLHKPAEKTVNVSVYSEKPEAAKVKVKNISDSRARLTWKSAGDAKSYHVLRKNVATGKYEEISIVDGGDKSTEVTRMTGTYKLQGVTTLGERTVKGKKSNAVHITGCSEKAKSYSGSKNLATLDRNNLEKVATITGSGNTNIPQSMSFNGHEYIVSYVNRGGTSGKLIAYSQDGKMQRVKSVTGMGHANGSTYNPNTGNIYTVRTHKKIRSPKCTVFKESDFSSAGSFNLPRNASGIAYDETNNKYYISKGNEIYVLDSEFRKEQFIWKSIRYNHAQDIGAYNGVVLVCTWVSGNKSYIDLYRISDEKYLGSYYVPIGEIESVVVDDGYLVILMNTIGSSRDYIYRTKERVAVP
jgi:sarcosine oxidase delta subunit